MPERRMLIVDSELAKRIEENRGDMSISEFINFLIDTQFSKNVSGPTNNHVTKEEFRQFEQGIRELLRNFLEFFLSYGMELGKQSPNKELDKLSQKLQDMGFSSKSE
jgi:hypothetical protein